MNLFSKLCGGLVALIWLAWLLFGLFCAYLLLTFYIFTPRTLAENFRANRFAIVAWVLAAIAFLTGTFGVFLRRTWARGYSFFLCAIGFCYAVGLSFLGGVLGLTLAPIWTAGLIVVLLLISAWLVSRGGREYFQRAVQPA
jgi:hypothetical protein